MRVGVPHPSLRMTVAKLEERTNAAQRRYREVRAMLAILVVQTLLLALLLSPTSVAQVVSQPTAEHLGSVKFPTSCAPEAQKTMERGVALLHSFGYAQAEQAFTKASQQDSKCAIACWGKAMALYHQLWDFPKTETLQEGRADVQQAQRLASVAPRARAYIKAAAAFYQDNAHV